MSTIETSLTAILEDRASDADYRSLASAPEDTAVRVVEHVRSGGLAAAVRLDRVMRRLPPSTVTAALLPVVEDPGVALFAIRMLGWARTPDARTRLEAVLASAPFTSTKQAAAEALAEIGSSESLPGLRQSVRVIADPLNGPPELFAGRPEDLLRDANENFDFDLVQLQITLAKACGRCGDHSLAYLAIFFSAYVPSPDDQPEARLLRATATAALAHVVGAGMIEALGRALADERLEVKRNALNALFYLGSRRVAEILIAEGARSDREEALIARTRFRDLTGGPYPENADDAGAWWAANQSRFGEAICYRMGQPMTVARLLAELRSNPPFESDLLVELNVISGVDLRDSDYASAGDRMPDLAKSSVGALLKSGRNCELPAR